MSTASRKASPKYPLRLSHRESMVVETATKEEGSLSNKDIDTSNKFVDETDSTKELEVKLSGATTGKTVTLTSAHTDDREVTLPNATDTLVGKATTDTLTNKTISRSSNTLSNLNIADADVSSSAAIARSKVDVGTANHVVINSGTGAFSSEAQLGVSRGGLGIDASAITGVMKANGAGTISAATVVDADVSATADIARTKLADGTAAYVVINDGAGAMGEEQYLAVARGGLGINASAIDGVVKANGAGVISASDIVNADVDAAAAIVESKLALDYGTTALNDRLDLCDFTKVGTYTYAATTFTPDAADVSVGDDTITLATHGLTTGDTVEWVEDNTLPVPFAEDVPYYVIVVDPDTIQLAASRADALAGTEINITDPGVLTNTMHINVRGTMAISTDIPDTALIKRVFMRITTPPTSGGAAEISVGLMAVNDIQAAAVLGGAPWSGVGGVAVSAVDGTPAAMLPLTGAWPLSITVTVARLTAGLFDVYAEYFVR